MSNKIILKKSSVASKVPIVSDLVYGELALNYADGKLYYRSASDTIQSISGGGGTGGGVSLTASPTAPSAPNSTDLWWDSTSGTLKLYYVDANTSQWVETSSPTVDGGISATLMIDGGTSTTVYTSADMVFDGGTA